MPRSCGDVCGAPSHLACDGQLGGLESARWQSRLRLLKVGKAQVVWIVRAFEPTELVPRRRRETLDYDGGCALTIDKCLDTCCVECCASRRAEYANNAVPLITRKRLLCLDTITQSVHEPEVVLRGQPDGELVIARNQVLVLPRICQDRTPMVMPDRVGIIKDMSVSNLHDT